MSTQNESNTNGITELLYIWISENETGFIQEQGFNFSSKYKFELNRSTDKRKYTLSFTERNNYPHIWKTEDNSIVGLTAIVGENGTGKSSLMKYLIDPAFESKWLHAYCIDEEIVIYHNFSEDELDVPTEISHKQGKQTTSPAETVRNLQTRIFISNAWKSLPPSFSGKDDILTHLVFSPDGKKNFTRLFANKLNSTHPGTYMSNQDVDIDELIHLFYFNHLLENKNENPIYFPKNITISFNFYDHLNHVLSDISKKLVTSISGIISITGRKIILFGGPIWLCIGK